MTKKKTNTSFSLKVIDKYREHSVFTVKILEKLGSSMNGIKNEEEGNSGEQWSKRINISMLFSFHTVYYFWSKQKPCSFNIADVVYKS